MSRIHEVLLFTVILFIMITAGCTQTTGPNALMTTPPTPEPTAFPTAPAVTGTIPPGAAGTQATGTCNADTMNDAANCGGCGFACPTNALCQQGQCYCKEGYTVENNACVPATTGGTVTGSGCPEGMSPCPDGYCYELAYDAANCGICGNQCPAGMICSASTCTNVPTESTTAVPTTTSSAAVTTTVTTTVTSSGTFGPIVSSAITAAKACIISGKAWCDGSCVDLMTSKTNCGECGKVCKSLSPTCCSGVCVNTLTSTSNCGTCGHKCLPGTSCSAGSCKSLVVITNLPGVTKIPTYVKVPVQNPIDPIGP